MGRLQWEQGRGDSACAPLIVGGIAVVLGGAALFGMVAHTWTPFLPQKGAGLSPFEAVARGGSVAPAKAAELPAPKRKRAIAFDPRPDEFHTAQAELAGAPGAAPEEAIRIAATSRDAPSPSQPTDQGSPGASPAVSMLAKTKPVELAALAPNPVEPAPPETLAAETWVPETALTATPVAFDPKRVVIRVADVKVAGANGAKALATDVRLVEAGKVEVKAAKAKPVEPRRAEPKVPVARRVEPKPAATKVVETRRTEPKIALLKVAEARRVEPKPIAVKVVEARRIQPRPVALRAASVRTSDITRAETTRTADMKAVEAKRAEAERIAEAKAAEAKAADARVAAAIRAAELKVAQSRIAELKRVAETMAAEATRAEAKRLADMKAADARIAEAKRAADLKIAEVKLVESQRAFETRAAEARSAVKPAVDVRPAYPGYPCDTCGTVVSVVSRFRDRGTQNWEVRVSFRDGTDRVFLYPTDPGLSSGERVHIDSGRLTRQSPRRSATYSPA